MKETWRFPTWRDAMHHFFPEWSLRWHRWRSGVYARRQQEIAETIEQTEAAGAEEDELRFWKVEWERCWFRHKHHDTQAKILDVFGPP